jgi:acyl-[acyl-carrier-protein]-phospholipid O-acyltransferase/long-chain-fatty-acid--[acyl-carrier-protein] ligase
MSNNQLELLTKRRFLPLFITQFLGAFIDNVFKNALVMLITYRLAEASGYNGQMLVTLAFGIFILPFFLFSATAGQLADKYEKSRIIPIVKIVEIILMVIATIGFLQQSIVMLMLVLFMLGAQATFFGPLKYAILPEQLAENELISGNGLIEAGTFLAILIGTIFGGLLILARNGEYWISAAIIFFAIGGWVSSCAIPKTTVHNPALRINYNVFTETYRVIQYSRERWDIFISILGLSWFWLVGAIFLAEFPVFTKEILHANQDVVTLFLTLFSVGIGVGSLLCNWLLKGRVHATYVPLGALGITLFTVDLYFAANFASAHAALNIIGLGTFLSTFNGWHIAADLVLIAICGGIYTVPLYAILQQRSDPAYRARVIASNNVINALFMTVAAIGTMLMLKLGYTVNQVFLVVAIANGFVAIYICKLLPDVLIKAFFRMVFSLLYRVEVHGLENYAAAGERVVIVANHTSFIDAALLATFIPDKLTFAVNTHTAKQRWIKFFLMMVNAFPLDPSSPIALKSLIEYVRQDKKCVIFPEGRLTVTGALMKIYEGPGLVADKAGAALLPVRIQGAQFTPFSRLKGKVHTRWFPRITITVFPAQKLDVPAEIKGRKRRQLIGYSLYDIMTDTMFESSDYRRTLFSSLINAKSTHGRKHPIAEDIQRVPVTYQQFITRSFVLGAVIAKKTEPGEKVGVLLPNMVNSAITFFALHAYCRVPAMLNFSTGIKNIVIACQTAMIKRVYTSRNFVAVANLTEMIAQIEQSGVTVCYLEDLRDAIGAWGKLKGFVMAQFPRIAYKLANNSKASRPLRKPDVPAVVLFTSGSEGTPKGVVLSHTNIQANRCQLSACVDFTANDKVFNALPIFHSFGLTGGMLLPLLSGVKVFFYPSPLHYRIIPEMSYDTNATILFGTETFLSAYAKYAHQYDFYSVRYVFAGAEKLREQTRLIWSQKFGVRIFEGYGTTETSPVLATNTPMENKVGTVGRFLPGIDYQLKPVPGIEDGGLLLVSGPNVMQGYLLADNPGVLQPPVDGWYDTGDIVAVDDFGYVTIKGRVKRFAKIAGEMVSLTMVEQQLNLLWPGFEHAVVSVPDEKKGEQIILVTTNAEAARDAMVQYAKTVKMPEIAIPRKIRLVKALPLLGTGKVDYVSVKNMCLEEA